MSAALEEARARVAATQVGDVTAVQLRDRLRALEVLVGECAVIAGTLELAAASTLDHWSLRGVEVRLQSSRDALLQSRTSLDAMLGRGAA